jgi:hypothetical protein
MVSDAVLEVLRTKGGSGLLRGWVEFWDNGASQGGSCT